MAEYIEREAAIRKINGEFPDAHYPSWYAALIEKQPAADVVEVVRCGKCKWSVPCREGLGCVNPTGGLTQNLLGKDDFCSGGERRSE